VGHGLTGPQARDTGFMAAGLALAGIGIGLTIAPIGTAVVNGVREQERGMAASLVIILRLIGMSISMSSMTAYGLRRTTVLSRELISPEDALDLEKTARVALDVVAKITGEMALISLAVAGVAVGAGLSTVPMACGAEELGTPAQPARTNTSSHTAARTRFMTRSP